MSSCSLLRALFIVRIFSGLVEEIATNEDIFGSMSFEARKNFFGTEDGSVPKHEIVKLENWHRSKGSPNSVISIPFTDSGVTTTVVLNLVEDHDLIGPRTTGIWFAEHNPNAFNNVSYTPRPDIFTNIGDFHFYQNSDEGSAITKFNHGDDNDILIGVLKHTYTIKIAPSYMTNKWKKRSLDHAAQTGFANSTGNRNNHSSPTVVIFKTPNTTRMNPCVLNHIQFANRRVTDIDRRRRRDSRAIKDVVYPKLLVSVDYNSVWRQSSEKFVRDLIAYLNVADMIYRQIKHPSIRLAVTGIILAQDELASPYIAKDSTGQSTDVWETLEMTSDYFSDEIYRFPSENYDVVIVMAGHNDSMWTFDESTEEIIELAGHAAGMGTACDRNFNAAAVKYRNTYHGVITFVHELGHLFNVDHDRMYASDYKFKDTCIMHGGMLGPEKLCWSSESRDVLRSFFRSEDSTCMHKKPKKVPDYVKSLQGTWLSLPGQCHNKYHNVKFFCDDVRSCQFFGCSDQELCFPDKESPMEGSISVAGKHCIDGQWMEIVTYE